MGLWDKIKQAKNFVVLKVNSLLNRQLFDSIPDGGMGSTYGGNPVACAAANAVLDLIEEDGLIERAEEIGAKVEARWKDIQSGIGKGVFGDVRLSKRLGLLLNLLKNMGLRAVRWHFVSKMHNKPISWRCQKALKIFLCPWGKWS